MNKELYWKVINYRTALALVKEMRSNGLVSEAEYLVICTVLASRFGLSMSTIFSEIDLISPPNDGNIAH